MHPGETVCLPNYTYKNNNNNSFSTPMTSLSSPEDIMDSIPYLVCQLRLTCAQKKSPNATFYCPQCNSLQCVSCEKQIHENAATKHHERLNLNKIDDEFCSLNKSHQAVLYCPTCLSSFCYSCFQNQHKHCDRKKHKPQKHRDEQLLTSNKNTDQRRTETKPMKINSSSNVNSNMVKERQLASKFEDVAVNDNDESHDSPPIRNTYSIQSVSRHNNNNSNHIPKQDNFNEQMLLDSLIEDHDDEDQIDNNYDMKKSNRLSHKSDVNTESNKVILLIDGNEHLKVNNEVDFIGQLNPSSKDPLVKCVSILGNTGDGKSYTLNQVFFNGDEKFCTSPSADSCTMGAWAALEENQQTLVIDTEGRLGLSQNDNIRNRLLLKILCISDVVIFRTKAPKLPNDMFQFLSDASTAFLKYFKKELENVMKNCKVDGPMSTMGPTLIVFHETQHTEVLRDDFQGQKTAVEQLKERFEKMNLKYDAYNSIEYVGIKTLGGKPTDFNGLKVAITSILENNKIRSPRRLSVIFKALKALNEKFNHDIPPETPSILPDDFFACCIKCLSCGTKCIMPANHQKENLPHQCDKKCLYNKELDNEVWKCLACHREGRDVTVYGKLITKSDGLVQGLIKYVWSGFVIECPTHNEIYRSRKYWYGNNEPKDVTRVEVIHVWPGDDTTRLASDVTPRKFMEIVVYAGSYLSAPTTIIKEIVADQVAPAYWARNQDVDKCPSCELTFGTDFSKHHCRACGNIFCDTCTRYRCIVPWIDKGKSVRVCDNCCNNPKSCPPSSVSTSSSSILSEKDKQYSQRTRNSDYENGSNGDSASTMSSGEHLRYLGLIPTDIFDIDQSGAGTVEMPATRRVYETFLNGLEQIGANYPIKLIKESARPNYWRPDANCKACFICNREFNKTNRLHHCRNCGDGVCETCSPYKRCVPERDWFEPVRICKLCNEAMNESNQ